MDNSDFFNASKYYLEDIVDGNKRQNNININFNGNNLNLYSKKVLIESQIKKEDLKTHKEYYQSVYYDAIIKKYPQEYQNDLELINSEIATLLNIPSAKIYRLSTENNSRGLIQISSLKRNEQVISIDKLVNRIISLLKTHNMDSTNWLDAYFALPMKDNNKPLKDASLIKVIIDMGLKTIESFFNLDDSVKLKLEKDYIRMLYFDLISHNSIRNFNDYEIMLDNNGHFSRFSPLNNFNIDQEINEYYLFNNQYLDYNTLFSVLYDNYYDDIKEISKGITENFNAYLTSINLIIDSNVNSAISMKIKKNYQTSLNLVKTLETIHSETYDESKLDIAMTQTSINLNAVNRNQAVHQKYDNYNISENNIDDLDETVAISVEPKKKNNLGKHILLIILVLLLLCGIGVGIAYLIMITYE
jgi:hypothetical protein